METRLRKQALSIFQAALKAADPAEAVLRHLRRDGETLIAGKRRYPLRQFEKIWVIGAGKASAAMGQAVERVLGARIAGGLICVKYGHGAPLRRVALHEAGHPIPDEAGVEGARRILGIANNAGPKDLVICLISGGASALTPYPAEPVSLIEKQQTTKLLLECGASIHEVNTVRKHISAFKGGQLAAAAAPATLVTLMLSDVIGDSLDVIGSGPTVPDESTFGTAREILARYQILGKAPASVRQRLGDGFDGLIEETPKPGDPVFRKTQNLVVGSNRLAVDAAERKARALGFRTLVLSTFIEGETRDVARMHAAILKEVSANSRPMKPPCCLISGGETTVTVRGAGLGGRNQEFVLAAAMDLAGIPGAVALSGGTDGTDGPTDAAGAIADGDTLARAREKNLAPGDYLARNDSYHFFEALGDLIKTGPTRTNVMDVRLMLCGAPAGGRR
jgi:hydroxypyruvate reductase